MATNLNTIQPTIDNGLFSFINFLKVVDYVTLDNVDSIQSLFFNLTPGQALGIDVDVVFFSEAIELTRGDFLLKQQNEQPLKIEGPANGYYQPRLVEESGNYYLSYEFLSERPTDNTEHTINNLTEPSSTNFNKYEKYKYKINVDSESATCYSATVTLGKGDSTRLNLISKNGTTIFPIIKTYYEQSDNSWEEIYLDKDSFSLTLSGNEYIVTNNSNIPIRVEVR